MIDETLTISKAMLRRLPTYYRYLKQKVSDSDFISSTAIASDLNLNPIQVRKDLAFISTTDGRPKLGFETVTLMRDIEQYLGFNNLEDAIIVGMGGMGRALIGYGGFKQYGLNIIMGFDIDEEICSKTFSGKKIFHLSKMPELIERMNVNIGIITTPEAVAQEVADLMVLSGIKGIWNFAPTHLKVHEDVAIKNEDMAQSLALLSNKIKAKINKN